MAADTRISAVINTYNAEKHLDRVLSALAGFDEIVVCDMESTDSTREIAARHGARIVTFPKGNHTICEPARMCAIQSAANPWVLVVDADEIVTPELRSYLYERISEPDCPAGIFIPRKNYMGGIFMRSSYPDAQLRFLRRDLTDWPPVIHSVPKVAGRVDRIPAARQELALVHLESTVASTVDKINFYTDNELEKRKGRLHPSLWNMMAVPAFHFFRKYVLQGGFRYGRVGFIEAVHKGYYKFLMLAKAYESEEQKKLKP